MTDGCIHTDSGKLGEDLEDGQSCKLNIPCVVTWHFMSVLGIIGQITICAIILRGWPYNLRNHIMLLALSNVLMIAFYYSELTQVWMVTIRGAPAYQWASIFGLTTAALPCIVAGWWLIAKLTRIQSMRTRWNMYWPHSESEIVSLVLKAHETRSTIRCVGSRHSSVDDHICALCLYGMVPSEWTSIDTLADSDSVECFWRLFGVPDSIWVTDRNASNQIMISLEHYTGIKGKIRTLSDTDDDDERYQRDQLLMKKGFVAQVTVRAGTCLGLNREDRYSKRTNGLVYMLNDAQRQLEKYGAKEDYALPDLGGVVMQSVGGFTAMGCSGGSAHHDYYESVHSIRMVDGTGTVCVFTRPLEGENTPDDPYWAVICSMGLMGIITEVTFNLLPKYKVLGSQLTWPIDPVPDKMTSHYNVTWRKPESRGEPKKGCCPCFGSFGGDQGGNYRDPSGDYTGPLNVYALNDTKPHPSEPMKEWDLLNEPESLKSLFVNHPQQTEYIRIWLWPQVEPNLWAVWKAHRALRKSENDDQDPSIVGNGEYVDRDAKQWAANFPFAEGQNEGEFVNVQYHEMGSGHTGVLQQSLLGLLYNAVDSWYGGNKWSPTVQKMMRGLVRSVYPTAAKGKDGQMYFGGDWCNILPMDQEMWTRLLPIQFTELWFDIEDTDAVMNILKKYWAENQGFGMLKTGSFAWEIYPAKRGGNGCEDVGGAWIRPSYGRTSFRVDICWYDVMTETPYKFFNKLWTELVRKRDADENIELEDVNVELGAVGAANDEQRLRDKMRKVSFRPHWAKWFPGGNVKMPDGFDPRHIPKFNAAEMGREPIWRDYFKEQYPKWDQWREFRERMDPRNVFMTDYWANTFGIDTRPMLQYLTAEKEQSVDSSYFKEKLL